jgi:hypothetical protein
MILLPLPLSFVPSSYNHYKPLTMSMGCEKEEKRKEKEKKIYFILALLTAFGTNQMNRKCRFFFFFFFGMLFFLRVIFFF